MLFFPICNTQELWSIKSESEIGLEQPVCGECIFKVKRLCCRDDGSLHNVTWILLKSQSLSVLRAQISAFGKETHQSVGESLLDKKTDQDFPWSVMIAGNGRRP